MQLNEQHWRAIRRLFKQTLFQAFATVNEDGTPHITPIGSLVLERDTFQGLYFEMFTAKMPANLRHNQRVTVMAVNSGILFWLQALYRGQFRQPPGVRLYGTAGERRRATEAEKALFQKQVKPLMGLKGAKMLWSRPEYVREISFDRFAPVKFGQMTKTLWPAENPGAEQLAGSKI